MTTMALKMNEQDLIEVDRYPDIDPGQWYVSPSGILCKPQDSDGGEFVSVTCLYHEGTAVVPKVHFQKNFKRL